MSKKASVGKPFLFAYLKNRVALNGSATRKFSNPSAFLSGFHQPLHILVHTAHLTLYHLQFLENQLLRQYPMAVVA